MKTRKEFTFRRSVLFANGKIVTKGMSFILDYYSHPLAITIDSVKYSPTNRIVRMYAKDAYDNNYLLEFNTTTYKLSLVQAAMGKSSARLFGSVLDFQMERPIKFVDRMCTLCTCVPFEEIYMTPKGSLAAKAYINSNEKALAVELDRTTLGDYSLNISDNKLYADFDNLFSEYFVSAEEAFPTEKEQWQPIPTKQPQQRKYINVIVNVDINATKEEIMAEVEKSIDTMLE